MLPVLAILWFILGFCWYTFCLLGYHYQWKIFTDNINTWNPMLARTTYSKTTNYIIMGACALVGLVGAVGLWFGCLWAIILAVLVSGNEAYRGATYYMKEGLYWEAIKHMIIHAFIVGYIFSWVIFVKYAIFAIITAWIGL